MRVSVHAYDVMGMLAISVSHSDLPVDGTEALHFARGAHVVLPDAVRDGSAADLLAYLAECLLDLAYDRG